MVHTSTIEMISFTGEAQSAMFAAVFAAIAVGVAARPPGKALEAYQRHKELDLIY